MKIKISFKNLLVSIAAAATFFMMSLASATQITYSFSGNIAVNHSKLIFTHFIGQFSFDSDVPDGAPGDTNSGFYDMTGGGLFGIHVTFDTPGAGTTLNTDPAHYALSTHLGLPVIIGSPPDPDYELASGRLLVNGDLHHLSVYLQRSLPNDALYLPAGGFTLADFDSTRFTFSGLPVFIGQPDNDAYGSLDTLRCISGCENGSEVPEPPSWALALIACLALSLIRRRRSL